MRKQLVKIGNSFVFKWNMEEREVYEMEEGDIFDIEMVKLQEDIPKVVRRKK